MSNIQEKTPQTQSIPLSPNTSNKWLLPSYFKKKKISSIISSIYTPINEEEKKVATTFSLEISMKAATLSLEDVVKAKKIASYDKAFAVDMIALFVAVFNKTLNIKRPMSFDQIYSCSLNIVQKYKYESFEDILYAFNSAKLSGMEFYQTMNEITIFSILQQHLESVCTFRQEDHINKKNQSEKELEFEEVDKEIFVLKNYSKNLDYTEYQRLKERIQRLENDIKNLKENKSNIVLVEQLEKTNKEFKKGLIKRKKILIEKVLNLQESLFKQKERKTIFKPNYLFETECLSLYDFLMEFFYISKEDKERQIQKNKEKISQRKISHHPQYKNFVERIKINAIDSQNELDELVVLHCKIEIVKKILNTNELAKTLKL